MRAPVWTGTWLRKRSSARELPRLRCRNTGQQPSISSSSGFAGPPAMPARAFASTANNLCRGHRVFTSKVHHQVRAIRGAQSWQSLLDVRTCLAQQHMRLLQDTTTAPCAPLRGMPAPQPRQCTLPDRAGQLVQTRPCWLARPPPGSGGAILCSRATELAVWSAVDQATAAMQILQAPVHL